MPGQVPQKVKPRIYTTRRGIEAVKQRARPASPYDAPVEGDGFTPTKDTDTINARLSPSEYVLPQWLVHDIRSGEPPFPGPTPSYMMGGEVEGYRLGGEVIEPTRRPQTSQRPAFERPQMSQRPAFERPQPGPEIHRVAPPGQDFARPASAGAGAPWRREAGHERTRAGSQQYRAPGFAREGGWRKEGTAAAVDRLGRLLPQNYGPEVTHQLPEVTHQLAKPVTTTSFPDIRSSMNEARRIAEAVRLNEASVFDGPLEGEPPPDPRDPWDESMRSYSEPTPLPSDEGAGFATTASGLSSVGKTGDSPAGFDSSAAEAMQRAATETVEAQAAERETREAEEREREEAAFAAVGENLPPLYEEEDYAREEAEIDKASRKAMSDALMMAGEQASYAGLPLGTAQAMQSRVAADISGKNAMQKAQRYAQMRVQNMSHLVQQYQNRHQTLMFAAAAETDKNKSARLMEQAERMLAKQTASAKELAEFQDMLNTPGWQEVLLGLTGSAAGLGAGYLMGGCWVAESLYGKNDRRTHMARLWTSSNDTSFTRAYMAHGEKWADWLSDNSWALPIVKPIWDRMSELGEKTMSEYAKGGEMPNVDASVLARAMAAY